MVKRCLRLVQMLASVGLIWGCAVFATTSRAATDEALPASQGQWQTLNSRYPVLDDETDAAIHMVLRSDFSRNTVAPMLTIDVTQHPLPMCHIGTEESFEITSLGEGLLNGRPQSFGYRCMGGQMTIVAWPQQPATYWQEQVTAQRPLTLSIAGVTFHSANINGRSAMNIAQRVFLE